MFYQKQISQEKDRNCCLHKYKIRNVPYFSPEDFGRHGGIHSLQGVYAAEGFTVYCYRRDVLFHKGTPLPPPTVIF